MKFKSSPSHRRITYRICDEMECNQIAMGVQVIDKGPNEYERHLCDSHLKRYKAELKDATKA